MSNLIAIVDGIKDALALAKGTVYSPPWGTDDAVVAAWRTNTDLVENKILPLLESTLSKAETDIAYQVKWMETAKSAKSALQFDTNAQGILNALNYTVTQSGSDIVNTVTTTTAAIFSWQGLAVGVGVLALLFFIYRKT
jgi:hypothetical protein